LFGVQTDLGILAGEGARVQIILEGHGPPIPVQPGDTVLAALLRAGVAFAFSCQAGNCGTCKCRLVSGEVLELEYSAHALAAEERAGGVILACRSEVLTDTVVRLLDSPVP
jgi:CDP-4-dehydro-6-deoxyglucose reductase/ferredoxin-NAD(P)+ reductase (naphthalene dioxygenase ferredoxin-specific)